MLSLLAIRNLALVDQLSWSLGSGLIGVTGETGAGKSVIVGALKLVLGERAEKSIIRTGCDQCSVEAVFEIPDASIINAILDEGGHPPCDETQLIVRRVISASANRQFINDAPVTLNLLKKIGEHLVDLHGPHDHQSLFSTERQLSMLDSYAGANSLNESYRQVFRVWREKANALEDLRSSELASEQELELIRFQLHEIDSANLQASDESELQERWLRASNASRITESVASALQSLEREDGIFSQIQTMQRTMRELEKLDPSLTGVISSFHQALEELESLQDQLSRYSDLLDINDEETRELEERVNLIETLKRKYGGSLQEVLVRREMVAARLDSVENRSEKIAALEAELLKARHEVDLLAEQLSAKRHSCAKALGDDISEQLKDLGFKQSNFEIQLTTNSEPTAQGREQVEFLFGPNPGEPLLPLRQVASSGEISRVMLAIKSALAEQDATPLMVFDEIDANVGGEIAAAVGRKMAMLGKRHQVIAITHFPQVAATANHHFVVEKLVTEGRTLSRLQYVEGEMRITELTRMLGGGTGAEARAMAEKLLGMER